MFTTYLRVILFWGRWQKGGASGSTSECQLSETALKSQNGLRGKEGYKSWGRQNAWSCSNKYTAKGTLYSNIISHAPQTQRVEQWDVSFDLQLPAPTCDDLDKRFWRQLFISHKKPWRKTVVWLKCCAEIQETKVHRYNSTKCLAGAFFRLVSTSQTTPLGHWKGTCIDTCKAFRPGEKAPQPCRETHFLKQSPIHPNTSPPSYPLLFPCFQSYTTGGKLSLIEGGNNSESLQPLISRVQILKKCFGHNTFNFFLLICTKTHSPWQLCFWIK